MQPCAVCGTPFTSKGPHHVYCSRPCTTTASNDLAKKKRASRNGKLRQQIRTKSKEIDPKFGEDPWHSQPEKRKKPKEIAGGDLFPDYCGYLPRRFTILECELLDSEMGRPKVGPGQRAEFTHWGKESA